MAYKNFAIGRVQIEGDRALVVTTGSVCSIGEPCYSNPDPNLGLDGGHSFPTLWAEATSGGSSAEGVFIMAMQMIGGKWYVTSPYFPLHLSVTKGPNNTAAQSNLQTALTGAKTYYVNSNQSFTGIFTGASGTTSDIQSIDTGLSYVSGGASTGPNVVSLAINAAGTDVVLTAFSLGTNDCWGLLDVTASGATIDGIVGSAKAGDFFFVKRATTMADCNAAGYLSGATGASGYSSTEWPHG